MGLPRLPHRHELLRVRHDALMFTSKERDSETGLDWFEARYFSGSQGRFTSPDQPFADQDSSNPQSWNLYSYGRNNPLRYNDPTGRCSQAAGGYTDEGKSLFPGPCANGTIGETPKNNPNSTTVNDFEPPSPLLLAVAQGAQRAERPVNFIGALTGGVMVVGAVGVGVGAFRTQQPGYHPPAAQRLAADARCDARGA